MNILKKEYWWTWLLMLLIGSGMSTVALGALLDVYDDKCWYAKWYYWAIGTILIIPVSIMIVVFNIQITSLVAAKLKVSGKELYLSPYIWIILLIIPILGWVLFIVLYLYLQIDILVKLYGGEGEKYI